MMMNKKRSSRLELSKYAVLIPVVVLASGAFTINQVEANIQDAVEKGKQPISIREVSESLNPAKSDTTEIVLEDVVSDTTEVVLEDVKGDVGNAVFVGRVNSEDSSRNKINGRIIEFRATKQDTTKGDGVARIRVKGTKEGQPDPIYFLDGEPLSAEGMVNINPNSIESIDILKGESAQAHYGEKGKNGVVLITTKKFDDRADYVDQPSKRASDHILKVDGVKKIQGKAGFVAKGTEDGTSGEGLRTALFVIDGERKKKSDMDALTPNEIEAVTILKDKHATDKYGEEAASGVVEITTKAKAKK